MRYTETELDKIIRIGCAKIDKAIERVIEKYCPVCCDEEIEYDEPEKEIAYSMFSSGNLFGSPLYSAQAQAAQAQAAMMGNSRIRQLPCGGLAGLFGGVL